MLKMTTNKDIIWAYLAQLLKLGSGFLLLPVMLYKLEQTELGLWYVFLALTALILLIEVGFQPTISRLVTYVISGKKEIDSKEITLKNQDSTAVDPLLLNDLCLASKSIYKSISIIIFLFFSIAGTMYLNSFAEFEGHQFLAWCVYISATVLDFYFGYYGGLLIGKGLQVRVYQSIAISKLVMLIITVPLLLLDLGLVALAIGSLVSAMFSRIIMSYYFNKEFIKIDILKGQENKICEIKKSIWDNAKKLSFTSVGNFFITKSGTFFISSVVGLSEAASYGLSLQVVGIISSLCSLLFTINLPKINFWQIKSEKNKIKFLLFKILFISNILYILGALMLISISIYIIPYLDIKTTLLATPLLLILLLIQYLELNHSICATYLTSLNIVPFVWSALMSGVAILILSYLVATDYGVVGVLLSRGVVQLMYNNWKWPTVAIKNLRA